MSSNVILDRRVVPPMGRLRPHRIWERNWLVYRRIWKVIFSGFFEPIFYLFSIGVGLGALVGELEGPGGELVKYTAFVAPGLLASSAMNGAVFETTFNIFFKLKYGKVYDGVLTTPMQPRDIALGEIGWSLLRGGLYAAGFVIVMLALGLIKSWWGLLALPGALLIGLGFGAVGFAATTFMNSWQDFDLVQLVTLPLFLFSATFYPITVYPAAIQVVVRLSPLYHGAEIIRGLTLGVVDVTMLGHVAFLLVMAAVGLTITSRRLERLLMK
jgi:lipooligosaccharide transport system permease protein